jgi:sterol O-acyltransferase
MAMLMKQHSYTSSNREFELKSREIKKLKQEKDKIIAEKKKEDKNTEIDSKLKALDDSITDLIDEITTGNTQYPKNVSFGKFVDYMMVPTLVYDLEYPRTEKFHLGYFMEKLTAILGNLMLLFLLVEHQILPVAKNIPNDSFIDTVMGVLPAFMLCFILIFFIIFEGVCNAFAELTLFADRDFYTDWWNSTSFDQYARRWNRPVHEFLLRHVYLESLETYKFSKTNATFLLT